MLRSEELHHPQNLQLLAAEKRNASLVVVVLVDVDAEGVYTRWLHFKFIYVSSSGCMMHTFTFSVESLRSFFQVR